MGLLDLIVSPEQRMKNQKRRIDKENRTLQADLDRKESLKEQKRLKQAHKDIDEELKK